MAETIRGINVQIGAETTGLSNALQDVNRRSRDIQSELRQVERLLRFDPSNTELLAQRQQLLGNAVSNTQERLDRLRAAQEQVNEQFRRGDISEGQYRAFQREVAAAEQQLRRFEDRLESSESEARNLGETLQQTGDKMKGAGEKMSVGLTAPIVAAGAVLTKGAADAQASMGKLQAALGITAEEAADLSAVSEAIWVNGFGENIEEATQAVINIRHNIGDLAEDEMQLAAEAAMTLAQVFDQDVNEVTRAAGVAMKNWGISAEEAMDLLTVGFQKGGNYSDELLDTIREYSPQFASMGIGAEQAMGMLIAGAQAGAWNLDKVGDAAKEFNLRAQDGSKTTAEGFAAIGLNAQEMGSAIATGGEQAQQAFMATVAALAAMEDPLAQNQAGVALFGTQWEDVRSQVIVAMAEGMKGLGDFQGATAEATNAMQENNPGLAFVKAMREVQLAVGPAMLAVADTINNTVVPAIKTMAEWFSNLSPAGQSVVLAIAGIVAIAGPLLVVLGSVAGIFSALSVAAATAGVTIGALVAPFALVAAAIAALIAIGVALYTNWDTIKAKGIEAFSALKVTVSDAVESAKLKITEMIDVGRNFVDGLWLGIQEKAEWVKEKVSGFIGGIVSTVKGVLGIQSPSTVGIEIGDYFAQGIAIGMGLGREGVSEEAELLANEMTKVKNHIQQLNQQYAISVILQGEASDASKRLRDEIAEQAKLYEKLAEAAEKAGEAKAKASSGSSGGGNSVYRFKDGYTTISHDKDGNTKIGWQPKTKLAKGALVTKPIIAEIGEGGEDEAVFPLSKLFPMMTDALMGAISKINRASPSMGVTGIDYDRLGAAVARYSKPIINQQNTFVSPEPISPSIAARQQERTMRNLALEWGF